jgi:hypothetical protein
MKRDQRRHKDDFVRVHAHAWIGLRTLFQLQPEDLCNWIEIVRQRRSIEGLDLPIHVIG